MLVKCSCGWSLAALADIAAVEQHGGRHLQLCENHATSEIKVFRVGDEGSELVGTVTLEPVFKLKVEAV